MINISPSIKGEASGSGWTCDKNIEKGTYLFNIVCDGWSEAGVIVYDGENVAYAPFHGHDIIIGNPAKDANRVECSTDDPDIEDSAIYLTKLY